MFIQKSTFRIVTLAIHFACSITTSNGGARDDFFKKLDSIGSTLNSLKCVTMHSADYAKCNETMKTNSSIDLKTYCCNLMGYRECVTKISNQYCGADAEKAIDMAFAMRKDIKIRLCPNYKNAFDCMDSSTHIFILIFVVAMVFICCCVPCLSCSR